MVAVPTDSPARHRRSWAAGSGRAPGPTHEHVDPRLVPQVDAVGDDAERRHRPHCKHPPDVPPCCGPKTAGSRRKNANKPYRTSSAHPRDRGGVLQGEPDTPTWADAQKHPSAHAQLIQGMAGCHNHRGWDAGGRASCSYRQQHPQREEVEARRQPLDAHVGQVRCAGSAARNGARAPSTYSPRQPASSRSSWCRSERRPRHDEHGVQGQEKIEGDLGAQRPRLGHPGQGLRGEVELEPVRGRRAGRAIPGGGVDVHHSSS